MNRQKGRLLRMAIERYCKRLKLIDSSGAFIFSGNGSYDDNSRRFPILRKNSDVKDGK